MTNANTVAALAVAAVDDVLALLHNTAPASGTPPLPCSSRNATRHTS